MPNHCRNATFRAGGGRQYATTRSLVRHSETDLGPDYRRPRCSKRRAGRAIRAVNRRFREVKPRTRPTPRAWRPQFPTWRKSDTGDETTIVAGSTASRV